MKISVIGTDYVGLVTGTRLVETGNDVLCIDIDEEKVKQGMVPIYKPYFYYIRPQNTTKPEL